MGRGKAKSTRAQGRSGLTQSRQARNLDKLAEFEVFDNSILPQLKRMVLENWEPERIRKAFAPILQALMIKQGLSGSFRAMKDTLDRHEGTAVQRINSTTVYASMSKKELAALALQKLMDAKIIDTTGRVIREIPQLSSGKDDDEESGS